MRLLKLLLPVMATAIAFVACDEDEPDKLFKPYKSSDPQGVTHLSNPEIFTATPDNNKELFTKSEEFSSEFDDKHSAADWEEVDEAYQSWIFKSDDTYNKIEDGELRLTLKAFDKGTTEDGKNGNPCYVGSGMLRSTKMVDCYGYYEARIKGADLWQGSCPAFWLYTSGADAVNGANTIYKEGDITYNEIDVIEIFQVPSDKYTMSSNLHLGVADASGKPVTKKANQYLKACGTEYSVDFNAEDEYHIYACENRPDSLVFYLDNKRVGAKPNYFWHMRDRMYITLSLGVRSPYEYYNESGNRIAVNPYNNDSGGKTDFDKVIGGDIIAGSTMYVDYVRAYTRKDGYAGFRNNLRSWDEKEFKNQ